MTFIVPDEGIISYPSTPIREKSEKQITDLLTSVLSGFSDFPARDPFARAQALVAIPRTSVNPVRNKEDAIKRVEDNLMDLHDLLKEHGSSPALQAMIDDTHDLLDYLKDM